MVLSPPQYSVFRLKCWLLSESQYSKIFQNFHNALSPYVFHSPSPSSRASSFSFSSLSPFPPVPRSDHYSFFICLISSIGTYFYFLLLSRFLTIDRLKIDTFEMQSCRTQLRFCQVSSFGPSARPHQTYIMFRTSRKYPYKSIISLRTTDTSLYLYVRQICHSHYSCIKHMLKSDVQLDEKQQYIWKKNIKNNKAGSLEFSILICNAHCGLRFHSIGIDNVRNPIQYNPKFQVISVCPNVWEHSRPFFSLLYVLSASEFGVFEYGSC